MGEKKKKPVKITPAPQAGDNKDFVEAAEALKNLGEPKEKRVRRTKAEIEGEKNILSDSGFELFRDTFKMGSDNDSVRYDIPKQPREFFEPLAKQWAMIVNYFLPRGKPIYFACVGVGISSFCMLKDRLEIINLKLKEDGKLTPTGKEDNINSGEKGNGQEFPSKITLEKV